MVIAVLHRNGRGVAKILPSSPPFVDGGRVRFAGLSSFRGLEFLLMHFVSISFVLVQQTLI